jgi:hypothetical protein
MTTRHRVALAVLAAVVILGFSSGPIVARIAAGRVRAAAAARGLTVSWRKLTVSGLGRVGISRVVASRAGADGAADSLFQADSVAVALDLGSLWTLRPRAGGLGLWRARIRMPARSAEPDTLVPDDRSAKRKEDPARAARLRHSAESYVRMLFVPARRLPRLELNDVDISTADSEDESTRGIRIERLDLKPAENGIQLSTIGSLQLDHEVPFNAMFTYDREDRIRGAARFDFTIRPVRVRIRSSSPRTVGCTRTSAAASSRSARARASRSAGFRSGSRAGWRGEALPFTSLRMRPA